MKLVILGALLVALVPGPAVRFESDGVRLGDEVVSGRSITLKSAGEVPVLISGSAVENLSSTNKALEVALDGKSVLLDVGIRLDRQGEGYRLSTHGAAFSVASGEKSLAAAEPIAFKVTEKGFDFGKAGSLEGSVLTAKIAAKLVAQDPATPPSYTPSGRGPRSQTVRANGIMHRVFGQGDPTVTSQRADGHSIQMLGDATPTNLP